MKSYMGYSLLRGREIPFDATEPTIENIKQFGTSRVENAVKCGLALGYINSLEDTKEALSLVNWAVYQIGAAARHWVLLL